MAKLLKPLVITLLLLSIISLVLGIMLFNQRETLKGRTQRLEQAAMEVARSLRFEDIREEQLQDYERMQAALNRLNVAAQNTYQELQDTIQDLANTRLDLEQTRNELAQTREELDDANERIARLDQQVADQRAEIAQQTDRIDRLERERNTLQARAEDLETELTQEQERSRELEFELAAVNEELDTLIEQIEGVVPDIPTGLTGRIMVVNPDWNFVVLDIGRDHGLSPEVEMLVHREDELIGKVRISEVEPEIAIAEIMNEWQQRPIREGDHVLF